jgi:hypothetical protein
LKQQNVVPESLVAREGDANIVITRNLLLAESLLTCSQWMIKVVDLAKEFGLTVDLENSTIVPYLADRKAKTWYEIFQNLQATYNRSLQASGFGKSFDYEEKTSSSSPPSSSSSVAAAAAPTNDTMAVVSGKSSQSSVKSSQSSLNEEEPGRIFDDNSLQSSLSSAAKSSGEKETPSSPIALGTRRRQPLRKKDFEMAEAADNEQSSSSAQSSSSSNMNISPRGSVENITTTTLEPKSIWSEASQFLKSSE